MNKRLLQVTTALTLVGLLVSIYMTIYKITANDNMCIGSQGCSVVNASRYSEVYGVPVAIIGAIGYLALLAVLWLERKPGFFQQNGPLLFFALSVTGFFFTLYLVYVEAALLKSYCPFCVTSQITMTLIFGISIVRLIKES